MPASSCACNSHSRTSCNNTACTDRRTVANVRYACVGSGPRTHERAGESKAAEQAEESSE